MNKKKMQEIIMDKIECYSAIPCPHDRSKYSFAVSLAVAEIISMQETDKPMQKVTTIADTDDQYWAERQEIAEKRIAERKKENKISHVAVMLQEFMKQANSEEYWQGERSGRGFVRGWARQIVEEVSIRG